MSWIEKSNILQVCKCGKEYRVFPHQQGVQQFCSKGCANKYRKTNKGGYKSLKGSLAKIGEKNPSFGKLKDNPSYTGLHTYMHKILDKTKPKNCEHCGLEKKLEMANKSHQYKRELDDWLWLCKKCHFKYDDGEKYLSLGRGINRNYKKKI